MYMGCSFCSFKKVNSITLQDCNSRPGNRQCKDNWKSYTKHVSYNETKYIGYERGKYATF